MKQIHKAIRDAELYIGHTCDGPITPFVLISRAIDYEDKEASKDALYNLLDSWNFLNDTTVS